jgi:putative YjhG/YagF family dehydratase
VSAPLDVYRVRSRAAGPPGLLPLTEQMLRESPSGDIFGLSQNAGMGWTASEVLNDSFLILSTQGGLRAEDGTPIALGYHTGHFEIGLMVAAAADELRRLGTIPFAAYCSDPCDGRSQGTSAMFDSLPYRNDAATVFGRLIRSLPRRKGVLGIATCDKGLPAMMMALAASHDLPCVLVPGGVTLPPEHGEDAGAVQTIGARFSYGQLTLREAAELGCAACASPGGGCQFLGTAATAQVVGEALGMSVSHSALAPSGEPVWTDVALRSARTLVDAARTGLVMGSVLSPASIRNAMAVHAAFGGSTNLLLHLPAIAHAAGLPRPTVEDWIEVNRRVPRIVSVLPNGPDPHPTVRAFLAGGVPEVMLHLRRLGELDTEARTVEGGNLGEQLDRWEGSERRQRFRDVLRDQDGVDPDQVIMSPAAAARRGLQATVTFPRGNLAPDGSVVKSAAIDPQSLDADGIYRLEGPARVFVHEHHAIAAIKNGQLNAGDVLVLTGCGPAGTGMEETYLPAGRQIAMITDARFSGVSTGACIGHVGPEGLAGGPIGKVIDGDVIRVMIDPQRLIGSIDLVGTGSARFAAEEGEAILAQRGTRPDLAPDPDLPDDTRLWAALQQLGGGTWGGCVYDVDSILARLTGAAQR